MAHLLENWQAREGRAINSKLNDPKFWSSRADEARTITEQLEDQGRKELMLRIAEDYDLLARLTKSSRAEPKSPSGQARAQP